MLQTVNEKDSVNCNEIIITELQKLADAFRYSGDQWRAHGYTKAISCIRSYGKDITSFDVRYLCYNCLEIMWLISSS